ncbi:hypothetical protein [Herbaspirillum sp. B65]|jgi:hypothetical protein|uniref:hypothetical protein n=1 Tax=Herbaspirillum sp. B65 TaxID=137708 RepID=UPI0020913753|nr:hypothetical protein [Herbaspirillum sp. B65]
MKKLNQPCASATALVFLLCAQHALAKGLSTSVSLSVSGTVTSISESLSAIASTGLALAKLAHGAYQVTDIRVAEDREDQMRLSLRAQGDEPRPDLYLYLTAHDYAQVNLGVGQTVTAMPKPYGLAFYQRYETQPFVVVLNDQWMGDLPARQVVLQ